MDDQQNSVDGQSTLDNSDLEISNETLEIENSEDITTTDDIKVKTFTQEEVDSIIGKRLAKEQRKWERNQGLKNTSIAEIDSSTELSLSQFDTVEEYTDALAIQKAKQLIETQKEQEYKAKLSDNYHEIEDKIRDRYSDFDQVAYNPKITITPAMAESIYSSDIGPEIAYYLGSNPKEASRIASLSLVGQAKEIGKLEVSLVNTPVKKTTNAPEPIKPLSSKASNQSFDTTDPRSTSTMSTSDWIKAERERQIKKLNSKYS